MTISIIFKNPGKPVEVIEGVACVSYIANVLESLNVGLVDGESRQYPMADIATMVAK